MNQKQIVYVVMSADIIHPGHINILKIAKEYAQKIDGEVVLGLLTDSAIASYKRVPFMNFEQRKLVVESLKYVDRIVAQDTLSYENNIRALLPRYVVHGDDWKIGVQQETRKNVLSVLNELRCGELIEPEYTQNISSTILNTKVRRKKISSEQRKKALIHLFSAKKKVIFMNFFSLMSAEIGNCTEDFDVFYFDDELASLEKNELISLDEKILIFERVFDFSNKPLICELHFTSEEKTIQAIQRLERIGVSGIVLKGLDCKREEIERVYKRLKNHQIDDCFLIFLYSQKLENLELENIDGFMIEKIPSKNLKISGELLIRLDEDIQNFEAHFVDNGKIFLKMISPLLVDNIGITTKRECVVEFFKRRQYERL